MAYMTHELDPVEREISEIIASVAVDGIRDMWKSDRIYTSEIKRRVSELGQDKGFQICCSGWTPPHGRCEWLYDLVWLQLKDDHIERVPLVLESEWSLDLGEIDWDFCKLLLARADHRVMILQQGTEDDVLRVFDTLEARITNFREASAGDRYLLLGYDWNSPQGFHRRLIVSS